MIVPGPGEELLNAGGSHRFSFLAAQSDLGRNDGEDGLHLKKRQMRWGRPEQRHLPVRAGVVVVHEERGNALDGHGHGLGRIVGVADGDQGMVRCAKNDGKAAFNVTVSNVRQLGDALHFALLTLRDRGRLGIHRKSAREVRRAVIHRGSRIAQS